MTRWRAPRCGTAAWQAERRRWRAEQRRWRAEREDFRAAPRAGRKNGGARGAEQPGPPPTGFTLLPWLLVGMGAISNVLQGRTAHPWIGGLGLLVFNSLYVYVTFRAFGRRTREAVSTRVALGLMGLLTTGLALGYGGDWLVFFPLLGLAAGACLRGPLLGRAGTLLALYAGAIAYLRGGWDEATSIGYATFISSMVTAAILGLSEAVRELRAAREELARQAVEKERLRFSRDLHDLLGHTLSVIVVKSEAARRLAPRDLDAALTQVADIESVGRQALTEIREAVTGYREGSLATELTRARSALSAASVEPVVHRSGTPLDPQTEALLGWVVREAVTNVVRHSHATRCEITVESTPERARLTVTDNGTGTSTSPEADAGEGAGRSRGCVGGTGLKGLTERLAMAAGSLTAGPAPRGGFSVTAEIPVSADALLPAAAVTAPRGSRSPS
ncbi:sensor histidine kinase [Streptomyces dangxiongensis]|uniref:Sensor histidine kinase n=1 Tax=Streptomyces dangxiongensis TaxID=1442032 RepID=A0A3G2JGQ7_9ACTN|nr:sensor histidine kinase [Streptomyces dangxiongensis]AYN41598.1 sensor histidine kinase [Streptomyces dangxiongensis]